MQKNEKYSFSPQLAINIGKLSQDWWSLFSESVTFIPAIEYELAIQYGGTFLSHTPGYHMQLFVNLHHFIKFNQ